LPYFSLTVETAHHSCQVIFFSELTKIGYLLQFGKIEYHPWMVGGVKENFDVKEKFG
jgi:hypothetical protein